MHKDPHYFQKLALQLRFELSEDEAKAIADEFGILIAQMDLLNQIDTQGIEPMVYPFETETSFLREDVVAKVFTQEEALSNAPKTKNGFIVTQKVVQ